MVTGIKQPSSFTIPKEVVDKIGADALNSIMALPFSDFKGLLSDALRKPAIGTNLYDNTTGATGAGGGSLSGGTFTMVYTDDTMTKDFTSNEIAELNMVKKNMSHVYRKSVLNVLGVEEIRIDGLIIAGGIFTSLLNNDRLKDIDVFLLDNPILKEFVKPRIASNFDKGNTSYLGNPMIEETYLERGSQYPIQFIFTKYKHRKELTDHFDYKHCVVTYDIMSDKMIISPYTYDCIKNKKLVVNNGKNIQLWREAKFLKRGFVKVAA
jgi:hypothetical protein